MIGAVERSALRSEIFDRLRELGAVSAVAQRDLPVDLVLDLLIELDGVITPERRDVMWRKLRLAALACRWPGQLVVFSE